LTLLLDVFCFFLCAGLGLPTWSFFCFDLVPDYSLWSLNAPIPTCGSFKLLPVRVSWTFKFSTRGLNKGFRTWLTGKVRKSDSIPYATCAFSESRRRVRRQDPLFLGFHPGIYPNFPLTQRSLPIYPSLGLLEPVLDGHTSLPRGQEVPPLFFPPSTSPLSPYPPCWGKTCPVLRVELRNSRVFFSHSAN